MPCDIPDEQMGRIISAIALPNSCQNRLLARLHLEDEVKRVERERKEAEQRQKRQFEEKLLEHLPLLWEGADLGKRHKILQTVLDVVYVDTVEEKTIIAIRPKPAFQAFFQVATTKGEVVWFYIKKKLPGNLKALTKVLRVSGGDGGGGRSPRPK
jgi:hypothetical protein